MRSINISNLDKNMSVETNIKEPDLRLYDVKQKPFQIYGLYNPTTESTFKRMPDEVAQHETMNESVKSLYLHTSGARIRFGTDSPYIAIKVIMPYISTMAHMPMTGHAGFDLYMDSPDGNESIFMGLLSPSGIAEDMVGGYEVRLRLPRGGFHYYTLNFPLYDHVDNLYIGLSETAKLTEGAPYRSYEPIVYYGSSITQGGCASHPGNSYQAMVARRFNMDFINLGFSSGGKGEQVMADYLASLPMSVFVCDYDHNASSADALRNTHLNLYKTIRASHPDVPYIMISRPDYFNDNRWIGGREKSFDRREVILETMKYAMEQGDLNAFFIDGEGIYRGQWEDCCTVDMAHPNDLGFSKLADSVNAVIKRAFCEGRIKEKNNQSRSFI